jgi:hypothetical protein
MVTTMVRTGTTGRGRVAEADMFAVPPDFTGGVLALYHRSATPVRAAGVRRGCSTTATLPSRFGVQTYLPEG